MWQCGLADWGQADQTVSRRVLNRQSVTPSLTLTDFSKLDKSRVNQTDGRQKIVSQITIERALHNKMKLNFFYRFTIIQSTVRANRLFYKDWVQSVMFSCKMFQFSA